MLDCIYKDTCSLYNEEKDICSHADDLCMRKYKIDYLLTNALLTDSQKVRSALYLDKNRVDFDAFNELTKIKDNIRNYINSGNNLYIYSKIPGNGKTSWAVKLLQSYILRIWPESKLTCRALFINVPKFLIELKSSISKQSDYIDHINEFVNSADLIIWDDIGTKVATEFEHEQLLSLIDPRLLDGKSNIFTSNITPNELSKFVGDRLASRIINTSKTVEFVGADKRGLYIK